MLKPFGVAAAIALLAAAPGHAAGQRLSVSFPGVTLEQGERVVGFTAKARAGRFYALEGIPVGWRLTVINAGSWHSELKAYVEVGAAALDPASLGNLITLERHESADVAFDLDVILFVMDAAERRRIVAIPDEKLILTPRSP